MQNTKIVLLGHTGFIGKEIFRQLKQRKIPVSGISSKKINFLKSDSPKKLKGHLSKNTVIIVAMAITRELGDNLQTLEGNIKIITNVARALENQEIKKCVYLSTADMYGRPENLPINERSTINPQTYYAVAKYTCETILQIVAQKCDFPLLILRYNGVFGPGQKNIGYGLNYFIKSIKEDGVVKIWGNGKELRDSLYVKDLAEIISRLSLANTSGIYNIAKGESIPFVDMLNLLKKNSLKKFGVEKRKRVSPAFNQIFDISKLKKVIPGFKFTPIEKSLYETYKAYLV